MIGVIRDRIDKLLGRGRHSIAVPVMDGPLHPNNRLEEARQIFAHEGLDNLTAAGGDIWFSCGADLMRYSARSGTVETVVTLEALITAIAANASGTLAIGLDGEGISIRGGRHDGHRITALGGRPLRCPTAALFLDEDRLAVTVGARDGLVADWKRDLMAHGQSGEVWEVDLDGGQVRQRAHGLAYPCGICMAPDGLVVSEAWAHRLLLLTADAKPRAVLDELPGYPCRIAPWKGGGYMLAMFAARNQLIEFVLREPEFLEAMTAQVHPDYWIAPKLMWGQGFKEPMQGAALKTMGIIKPWAPTWSYGLVVALDQEFAPRASYHSRADGRRHGVTSLCEFGGSILAGSKGGGVAVTIGPLAAGGQA